MKGKKMANKSNWASLRHALLGFLLVACGGAVGVSTVGGESHFLRHCGDGCGPGLDCIADICTRSCIVAQDSCADLAKDAACTAASIEPGAIAVCDAACTSDAACKTLGDDFSCQAGFCREEPSVQGGGAGGHSVPGGSGGSGGSTFDPSAGAPPVTGGANTVPDWSPPSRCLQPFDEGICDALFPVFAFEDGQCVPRTYGGCEGNDNRFSTIEECISVCQGAPSVNECPDGRIRKTICIACGPAGGCAQTLDACARPCELQEECSGRFVSGCFDGVCQTYGCY